MQGTDIITAKFVDEVTPNVQKMQDIFSGVMDQMAGDVVSFEKVFEGIDKYVPDFGALTNSFQDIVSGSLSVEGHIATLTGLAKDAGGAYFELGLQTAGSFKDMLGSSEEALGAITGHFQQFIPNVDTTIAKFQDMLSGTETLGNGLTLLTEIIGETGNAYVDMGLEAVTSLTDMLANTDDVLGSVNEFFTQFKEDALTSAAGFSSAVTNIGAQFVAQAKNQIDTQRKADLEKIKNSTMSEEEKAKAIAEIDKKAEAEKKKLAIAEKGMAITKAVINAALAVSSALTTPPFPVGLVMAGIAAASGAAQVAAISAQTFADGGIVPGTSYSGDMVAARVNSGEMILNRSQQSQLFAMANGQGGGNSLSVGGDTIVINGNADQTTVDQIRQTRTEQIEEMKELLKEMQYHGQLEL